MYTCTLLQPARCIRGRALFHYSLARLRALFEGAVYSRKYGMYTQYCKHNSSHIVGPTGNPVLTHECIARKRGQWILIRALLVTLRVYCSYCTYTICSAYRRRQERLPGEFQTDRHRYAGSRDSWRPLLYCRQWRIVPPSLSQYRMFGG